MINLSVHIVSSREFREGKSRQSAPTNKRYEKDYIESCLKEFASGKHKTLTACSRFLEVNVDTLKGWIRRSKAASVK